MSPEVATLYERLQNYRFDEGQPSLPFHRRLARENGWTPGFTARAIAEYRKFLLLTKVAGHPVTPSDTVDQVWHLHLVYTRSYWDRLCGEILGVPLHHEPTEGGAGESRKFYDWYSRTLESYGRIFSQDPPPVHNFSFTSEVRYWFVYDPNQSYTLSFTGDDDVWVFINRKLALDSSGIHTPADGKVTLDAAKADALGLQPGKVYEVAVFQAERQTYSSTYKLTLTGFNTAPSQCTRL